MLILVNTDGFDGHHKERFGRALPRSKPGRVLRRVSELGRQQSYPLALIPSPQNGEDLMSLDELKAEAMKLSPESRAELAHALLLSLDDLSKPKSRSCGWKRLSAG